METRRHYDADKAWERVNTTANRKQRNRLITGIGITTLSVIAALFVITPYFQSNTNERAMQQELAVNHKKAILYLNGGSEIELTDSLDHSLDQIIVQQKISPAEIENVKTNVLVVPIGGEYYFELPDGTKVWLNSQTRLEFPTEFKGNTREIVLTGQAYFDVVHNPEKPFIVHTNLGDVEVKGTSFDLKVYSEDQTFETTLVEGLVSLKIPSHPDETIHPGQRTVFSETTGELKTKNVDVQIYTSWKNGIFYFENQNLGEIAKQMERWYEIVFDFTDENTKQIRYTGEYNKNQNIDEILQLLSNTGGVNFTRDGKNISVGKTTF